MEAIREYLMGVTAASIICACAKSLVGEKGASGKVVKLICGLFLAFTVVRPMTEIQISDFALMTYDVQMEAQAAVSTGEEFVQASLEDIIKAETEAYILDKARELDADIRVEVTVTSGAQPVPETVCINGKLSPYAKAQLKKLLEEDLGIPKEGQLWIG